MYDEKWIQMGVSPREVGNDRQSSDVRSDHTKPWVFHSSCTNCKFSPNIKFCNSAYGRMNGSVIKLHTCTYCGLNNELYAVALLWCLTVQGDVKFIRDIALKYHQILGINWYHSNTSKQHFFHLTISKVNLLITDRSFISAIHQKKQYTAVFVKGRSKRIKNNAILKRKLLNIIYTIHSHAALK